MALLVFSRGSYALAIWFQGEDGGQDTLMLQWRFCFCKQIKTEKGEDGDSIVIKPCYLLFAEKLGNNLWMRDEILYKQLRQFL